MKIYSSSSKLPKNIFKSGTKEMKQKRDEKRLMEEAAREEEEEE